MANIQIKKTKEERLAQFKAHVMGKWQPDHNKKRVKVVKIPTMTIVRSGLTFEKYLEQAPHIDKKNIIRMIFYKDLSGVEVHIRE